MDIMPAALRPRPLARRELSNNSQEIATQQRASIRKFRGNQCPILAWDGLRKDSDLWFEDGDCFVHLYACGSSKRGPSFRLHSADVMALASSYILDECLYIRDEDDDSIPSTAPQYDVYIPTPLDLPRSGIYSHHLSTRNCFAFAAGMPLVGQRLGDALIQLWDRLQEWDSRLVTSTRFFKYCENQGYMNLTANTGHSLSMLRVAEHIQHAPFYIDAFVHCVGMQDRLDFNPEFVGVSNESKVLIERAALEMDLHIEEALQSLGTFLEDEINADQLNLSKPARDHLDRFRSFLINFYVEKLGYYPPPIARPWKKRLWTVMYSSFNNLYDYLADTRASTSYSHLDGHADGVAVVPNVRAFDQRHGFEPLPHCLPLLPNESTLKSRSSHSDFSAGLRNLRFHRSNASSVSLKKPLEIAANMNNEDVLSCALVKEYQRFERQKLEEKLPITEARKVRWILIYSVLQMLTSIVRAPVEVRDANSPPYPICVLTTDCPPWKEAASPVPSKRDSFMAPSVVPFRLRGSDFSSQTQQVDVPVAPPRSESRLTARHIPAQIDTSNTSSIPSIDSPRTPSSPRLNSLTQGKRISFIQALPVHPALRAIRQETSESFSTFDSTTVSSPMSRSSSQRSDTASTSSSQQPPSMRLSFGDCDSPNTDPSSEEECNTPSTFDESRTSYMDSPTLPHVFEKSSRHAHRLSLINAGCYLPTGFADSKLSHRNGDQIRIAGNRDSIASDVSASSSVYSNSAQQAADIKDEVVRGRQKLAAVMQTREYGLQVPRDLF